MDAAAISPASWAAMRLQGITPRFIQSEFREALVPLARRMEELERETVELRAVRSSS
jgi:hypothetical protein